LQFETFALRLFGKILQKEWASQFTLLSILVSWDWLESDILKMV
jgi:hypothetical protein